MFAFDPTKSIFAGMDTPTLQAALTSAQNALIALSTGSKGETFSYTQGDGAKSVTYTRANLKDLTMLIRELQAQLGIIPTPRKAIRVAF